MDGTTREALAKLPDGHCFVLSAPRVELLICGVVDARIATTGEIRLVYEDGTEERAMASNDILDTDMSEHSLIRWVGHVQGKRPQQGDKNAG